MAHLVQVVRVCDDELPAAEVEHVELDQVDPRLDGCTERAQRVLGGERRCPPVADPERTSVASLERDHGEPGRVGR